MRLPRLLTWEKFYTGIVKGLKVFAFYLAVLSFFRVFFIYWLHDYMPVPGWPSREGRA